VFITRAVCFEAPKLDVFSSEANLMVKRGYTKSSFWVPFIIAYNTVNRLINNGSALCSELWT